MYLLFLLFSSILSNTIYIPNDYSNIQDGIDNANNGDSILVYPGTYYENLEINEKSIILLAVNSSDSTIIDGNYAGPVIIFNNVNTEPVELNGFTIQNGNGEFIENATFGGGILSKDSYSIIKNSVIKNNSAFAGGGICYYSLNYNNQNNLIANCEVKNNNASEGGGVFSANHIITIENSNFNSNGMDLYGSGGGIQILLSELCINNSTLSNNETRFGGGIYIGASNAVFNNTIISNNYSDSKGGGIWIGSDSNATINYTLISNNQSTGFGGGIFVSNSYLDILNTTISKNIIDQNVLGAGIYMDGGNASIINSIIYYNRKENSDETIFNLGGYSSNNFHEYDITYTDIEGENIWLPDGIGNISSNPLFVDLINNNFNLLINSPCIDSGSPWTFDLDNTITDMGAYYYNQTSSGDLNYDSTIDILDIIILINLILNNEYDNLGDMNLDGVLNVQDAIIIINTILTN